MKMYAIYSGDKICKHKITYEPDMIFTPVLFENYLDAIKYAGSMFDVKAIDIRETKKVLYRGDIYGK